MSCVRADPLIMAAAAKQLVSISGKVDYLGHARAKQRPWESGTAGLALLRYTHCT